MVISGHRGPAHILRFYFLFSVTFPFALYFPSLSFFILLVIWLTLSSSVLFSLYLSCWSYVTAHISPSNHLERVWWPPPTSFYQTPPPVLSRPPQRPVARKPAAVSPLNPSSVEMPHLCWFKLPWCFVRYLKGPSQFKNKNYTQAFPVCCLTSTCQLGWWSINRSWLKCRKMLWLLDAYCSCDNDIGKNKTYFPQDNFLLIM